MHDTPTFRAEYRTQDGVWRPIIWRCKAGPNQPAHGLPTDANAERLRQSLNRSFNVGGVNWHASEAAGYVLHVSGVRVIRQRTGDVVAQARAPMFEVIA